MDRIPSGLRSGMIIGSVYSILAFLVILFFGQYLATLFVDGGEIEIIQKAHQFLIANGSFYIPLTAVNIFRLYIQGMGFSKLAMFAGVFEMIARTIAGLVLVPVFGYTAACFANPFAWCLADVFLIPAYFYVFKRLKRQFAIEQNLGS